MARSELLALLSERKASRAPASVDSPSTRRAKLLKLIAARKAGEDPEAAMELSALADLEIAENQAIDIIDEPKSFFASGSESMEKGIASDDLEDIINAAGALQSETGDVISTFQDDETFGTGERLTRPNPIGQAFEEDVLSDNKATDSEFYASLLSELGDDEVAKALATNDELMNMMKAGIDFNTNKTSKGSGIGSGAGKTELPPIDPNILSLMRSMGVEDLSASALQADIIAGIGERFRGERPSFALTRSGAFKGTTPDVARSLLGQRLRERTALAKIEAAKQLQKQRSALEFARLGQRIAADKNRLMIDMKKMGRREKNDRIKAINTDNRFLLKSIEPTLRFDDKGKIKTVTDPDLFEATMMKILGNNDIVRMLNGLKPLSKKEKKERLEAVIDQLWSLQEE